MRLQSYKTLTFQHFFGRSKTDQRLSNQCSCRAWPQPDSFRRGMAISGPES